jgi:antitoxin (DNA-binding transcriptional repressor) of toxin-antitoxin stability system
MNSLKVGIREFRSQLPHYLLEVGQPLAITRHGEAIGYYTPTRDQAASYCFIKMQRCSISPL